MLGKILKYELKASARIFLLMYAALLVLAAINAVIGILGEGHRFDLSTLGPTIYSIASGITMAMYFLAAAAVIVITTVIIVLRFYRMLGNEGYLWFTLPVTANQHILGKLIPALVWSLASCVVILISFCLLTVSEGLGEMIRTISEGWGYLVSQGFNPGLWVAWFVAYLLVAVIYGILMFYAAMAVGPNIIKSRLGGSVLAYLILYVIVQVLSTLILMALAMPLTEQALVIAQAFDPGTMTQLEAATEISDLSLIDISSTSAAIDRIVLVFLGVFSALSVVLAVAFYIVTRHCLTRKLNLA